MANINQTGFENEGFAPAIAADMHKKGIDLKLTRKILDKINQGVYDHVEPVRVTAIPEIDGKTIIDLTGPVHQTLDFSKAQQNIDGLGLKIDLTEIGQCQGDLISFDKAQLIRLGKQLYPVVSYGILNGGSASSFFDIKKNQGFNSKLYQICAKEFATLADLAKDKAKGLAPAFINQDSTPGPSFIELKMRAVLIQALQYQHSYQKLPCLTPLFQMTSVYNNEQISAAYQDYRHSQYLSELIQATGIEITRVETGVQPMLAAFTHSREGRPKSVFSKAYGIENNTLPMPGGHGQNFAVLRQVYRNLLDLGIRFVYLGNVDNLGYTVNPLALALLALTGKAAGFEFSFRTAVDIKGGILIYDQYHRLNCADIGPAISGEAVCQAESSGKSILFNCATGLFNLPYLVEHLDTIIENLPLRVSDQEKDAGYYSQAEQVTWEIIGLLDDFLIFGVNKYERFLAAKLVLEGLMASGIGLSHPEYPTAPDPKHDLLAIARKLNQGLEHKLATVYGLKKCDSRWEPKTVSELLKEFTNC
ncbi:MAG TPA: UTP--glucose-1-phosphate uridylyltransferase [Bacillota bacterium]